MIHEQTSFYEDLEILFARTFLWQDEICPKAKEQTAAIIFNHESSPWK